MGIYLALKSIKIIYFTSKTISLQEIAKIRFDTAQNINFETKPENDGISFRCMKRQKEQFLDFLMERRKEMIV